MGSEQQEQLPAGYTRLKYLEADGMQYIDTGVPGSTDMYFAIDGETCGNSLTVNTYSGFNGLFDNQNGLRNNPSINLNFWQTYYNGVTILVYARNTQICRITGEKRFGRITMVINGEYAEINGERYPFDKSVSHQSTQKPIYLFKINTPTTITDKQNVRLYYASMDNRRGQRREYIPALAPAGRPCLFDLVNRTPYFNAGTGEFSYA